MKFMDKVFSGLGGLTAVATLLLLVAFIESGKWAFAGVALLGLVAQSLLILINLDIVVSSKSGRTMTITQWMSEWIVSKLY